MQNYQCRGKITLTETLKHTLETEIPLGNNLHRMLNKAVTELSAVA